MKRAIHWLLIAAILAVLLCGCGKAETVNNADADPSVETAVPSPEGESTEPAKELSEPEESKAALADGEYAAEFRTDSSMFHVNESCDGKGLLTVKDGQMTIHVSLASTSIVNLYPGMAEDAKKEGAALLQPTTDTVTYEDGMSEEVYGFDIPVPALDTEFPVALVGTKGNWYDHQVVVSLVTEN